MFRFNKKYQNRFLYTLLFFALTLFIGIPRTSALTLEQSKIGFAIEKLAVGSFSINYDYDLVSFPNNNYMAYGINISYANTVRTNSDGSRYAYLTSAYNNTQPSSTATTLYITSPNTPNPLVSGDKAELWVQGSDGIVKTYAFKLGSSCETYAKMSADMSTVQIFKCGKYNYATGKVEYNSDLLNIQNVQKCPDGYERTTSPSLITDECPSVKSNSYGLSFRLCSQVYQFKCSPKTAESAKLSSLYLSTGEISPTFSSTTYTYTATVSADNVVINASVNSYGSFVSGYGPRTVDLSYGANAIQVKIQSNKGSITTYTININRPDDRSNVNTLSGISSSVGTLKPSFDSTILDYELYVPEETTAVEINATRTDQTSVFLDGYGSRELNLNEDSTMAYIKVQSALGAVKTYAVVIKKGDVPPENTTDALLKSIEVAEEPLSEFTENKYEYNLSVPYETSYAIVNAYPKNETDTVVVNNVEELVVGPNIITIKVTAPNKFDRTYTLNIIRKELDTKLETNPDIKDIKITGYDFKYEPNETSYDIKLKKGDTSLKIKATPVGKKSVVNYEGNKDLKYGSKITITCVAEDGSIATYEINITGVEKGANTFLIVLLIIMIGALLVYVVLRLLGYKIYFNFSMIGSMFRSIGQKIKNIFDR